MDSLISRQTAIDEVSKYASIWMEYDADMTQEEVAEAALKAAKRTMVHILEELPPALPEPSQVARDIATIIENEKDMRVIAQPEIIRCKDCKHRYIDGEYVRFNVCELNHNKVQSDDWFCADAERKEGEAE